jgi:hypothetical protein
MCVFVPGAGDVQEALDSAAKASAAHTAAAAEVDALRQQLAALQQEVGSERRQWRQQEAQAAQLQEQVGTGTLPHGGSRSQHTKAGTKQAHVACQCVWVLCSRNACGIWLGPLLGVAWEGALRRQWLGSCVLADAWRVHANTGAGLPSTHQT